MLTEPEVPSTTNEPPATDRQLELEMQALAELLLDIYEWRHQNKKRSASESARSCLDANPTQVNMGVKAEQINSILS